MMSANLTTIIIVVKLKKATSEAPYLQKLSDIHIEDKGKPENLLVYAELE